MDTGNSPKSSGKAKILATTGLVCAMGGYICGDKSDEHDKLKQNRQPYEIAASLLDSATKKQAEWLKIQEQIESSSTSYRITIDSLERIIAQLENYQYELGNKNFELKQCENSNETLQKEKDGIQLAYENEQTEVKIRDNQIDSLETLAQSLQKEISSLQDDYRDRSPIENEFQAIHNCINAQGHSMSPHEWERQVKCCIKTLKKLQKKYPKDKFEDIALNCNAN